MSGSFRRRLGCGSNAATSTSNAAFEKSCAAQRGARPCCATMAKRAHFPAAATCEGVGWDVVSVGVAVDAAGEKGACS